MNTDSVAAVVAPQVEVLDLEKSYRDGEHRHPVLRQVRLNIAPGEMVALLGRSGSGKSTLLHLLSGIDLPDAGAITVAGQRIDTLSERQRTLFRRRHIGLVFQFFNLIPALTVLENVLLPLQINGALSRASQDFVRDLLHQVGLSTLTHRFPEQLSGGEQQRVAIVRALAHRPQLLLADEPTGNLDQDTGDAVLALFAQLQRQLAVTLLIATHSEAVAGLANRCVVLDKGSLA